MKKKTISILVLIAFLVIATPAVAGKKAPVGSQIGVISGPTTFPAGAAFHIRHGWIISSDTDGVGIFDFELEVDGVLRNEDFVLRSTQSGDPDLLLRFWVHNFPDGMTGVHTFTGHWFVPCQPTSGSCATPNAKVEVLTSSVTVTFVTP